MADSKTAQTPYTTRLGIDADKRHQLVELLSETLALGGAASASPETRSLRLVVVSEETDTFPLGATRRAAGTAENMGRVHCKHEAPIEAWIAIAERLPAVVEIEHWEAPWVKDSDCPPWPIPMPIHSALSNLRANMEARSRLP